MGSLYMRGNRADADTFLTSQMRKAGLNLIGRTTTPEFGVCSSAENPAVYITRNPWNTDYTTCRPSTGSGAMVAAGVVPIAHAKKLKLLGPRAVGDVHAYTLLA